MEFNELKKEAKNVAFDSLRMDCDNYFEAVVIKDELGKLVSRLDKLFGSPAWPSKNRLPLQIEENIKGYGGIIPGQTLYYSRQGNESLFAMLWPWQDGVHTTVKIVKQ